MLGFILCVLLIPSELNQGDEDKVGDEEEEDDEDELLESMLKSK